MRRNQATRYPERTKRCSLLEHVPSSLFHIMFWEILRRYKHVGADTLNVLYTSVREFEYAQLQFRAALTQNSAMPSAPENSATLRVGLEAAKAEIHELRQKLQIGAVEDQAPSKLPRVGQRAGNSMCVETRANKELDD